MRHSVLVADDDDDIRELISARMAQEGYAVLGARSVSEIRATVAESRPDLMILDLNLPDGDGLALCRQLRQEGYAGAVIMVTARDGAIDRVLGLELGADDYLAKPFEPRELIARVRNLLRRNADVFKSASAPGRVARFGDWRFDLIERYLIAPDGRHVILSSAEYRLLERFIEAPNRILSREDLFHGKVSGAADQSVVMQISRLRQKLSIVNGRCDVIKTVRNEGYILASEVHYE